MRCKPFPFQLILLFLSLNLYVQAQDLVEDFSFFRTQDIPVCIPPDTLRLPWAGGINGVRFSEIDLDLDGTPDLFAFEKHGNRILPFLRRGSHYQYAPEYAQYFPDLHDWVILKDYNSDGKPDIFTYGLAGIRVFRNVSETHLEFHPITEQLQAYYFNGYVNIFASPDDYLVVEDIDQDGHLDILNFWVLGKYVHHLRNYSNDPETLDFFLEDECWGQFEEASDNNTITLFSLCDDKSGNDAAPTRHTGSSMLLHDFDNNGLNDILIGDIDYPNLILLYNHGNPNKARMTAQDTAFPNANPVHLYSMPTPSLVQLPGQNHPTLLVSPTDPTLNKSQDINSVWRYDYDSLLQQFVLTSTAFLQDEMIDAGSGNHPVLFDWDGDGLQDLFIANYGSFDSAHLVNGFLTSYLSSSIQYFKNTGTATQPAFRMENPDFGQIKSLGFQALHPTFGDFDGDGLTDMLCGEENGTLLLIPHSKLINGNGNIIADYGHIQVGKYSTPYYFDLDNDGNKDLIIGNQRGLLSYYKNLSGGSIPVFTLITDTLGGVDVRNHAESYYGYSVPCLYRDAQHGTTLFCGSEQGRVLVYRNIDQNVDGIFSARGNVWESEDAHCQYCARPFREGRRVGAAIADLNGDNYPDLIVGNHAGGAAFFSGRSPVMHHAGTAEPMAAKPFRVQPNPTTGRLQITGLNEAVENVSVFDLSGRRILYTSDCEPNLAHLADGFYIVEINHRFRVKVGKIGQ